MKFVKSLFGGGEEPAAPTIPVAPLSAPSQGSADDAVRRREEEDALRRRKGRAAALLTGEGGAGLPKTATKTLLGG